MNINLVQYINWSIISDCKSEVNEARIANPHQPGDFGLPTSSFTICTFWMINSLFKIGEKKEAKRMFEKLLSHSNHVGLFSEDIDFESKRLLGNFPQAYSHLALIETEINLSDAELSLDQELLDEIH